MQFIRQSNASPPAAAIPAVTSQPNGFDTAVIGGFQIISQIRSSNRGTICVVMFSTLVAIGIKYIMEGNSAELIDELLSVHRGNSLKESFRLMRSAVTIPRRY